MKGIIFNLLEEVVRREHGEDTWDALLESAGLEGSFTSLGNYPDEHLLKLVGAASAALRTPPDAIVRWFGRSALPLLAERYPRFLTPHTSVATFLLTLNDIIHTEVRKLYPGADVPTFDFGGGSPGEVVMGYRSPRRLCALAEGFIEGAAAHYNEEVSIRQSMCMNRGDEKCLIHVAITKSRPATHGEQLNRRV